MHQRLYRRPIIYTGKMCFLPYKSRIIRNSHCFFLPVSMIIFTYNNIGLDGIYGFPYPIIVPININRKKPYMPLKIMIQKNMINIFCCNKSMYRV